MLHPRHRLAAEARRRAVSPSRGTGDPLVRPAMGMICCLSAMAPAELEKLEGNEEALSGFLADDPDALDLDKGWHGLHFLLTGSAWGGEAPLNFIVLGGRLVAGSESGYGPARYFTPEEARGIHEALRAVSVTEFVSRFDPEAMSREKIYPEVWTHDPRDLPDLLDWMRDSFEETQRFIATAAGAGKGLLVSFC